MGTRRRLADLPLHGGRAPAWLMQRMIALAGAIATLVVRDAGPDELLRRLSDPFWFQAFGCVLGFDWHSSGVTTTVCAALKAAARRHGEDIGITVCGGKGATSRKTPEEIRRSCDATGADGEALVRASRLAARVDSAAVQDGYQLYHHAFFFASGSGRWCIVQQGLNAHVRYARRYHWLAEGLHSYVADPHAAIACDRRTAGLNLVAGESDPHRAAIAELGRQHPDRVLREIRPLFADPPLFAALDEPGLVMPRRHSIEVQHIQPAALRKVLVRTYEAQAQDFEQLLGQPGLGPQALRSLSLIAEVIYNAPASRRDPAAYSFAHGGKDGHPYHVNRALYDANIERLRETIGRAKIGATDRVAALKSLAAFVERL